MKRYLSSLLACLAASALAALTPEEAGRFPLAGSAGKIVWKQSFDDPGLKLPPGYNITPEGALHYRRTDPGRYELFTLRFPKLDPRCRYTLRVKVRGRNLEMAGKEEPLQIMAVEFNRYGKWSAGIYRPSGEIGEQWRQVSREFNLPPEDGIDASAALYLHRGYTGELWFDDAELVADGEAHSLVLTAPDRLTFDGGKNMVRFRSEQPVGERQLYLCVTDTAGSREFLFSGKGYDFFGEIGELSPGKVTVAASLVDPRLHRKLHTQSYQLTRLAAPATPGCRIDEHGRAIVDGKPFLPVGAYIGTAGTRADESDWEKIAAAGFNCVLDYGSHKMCFGPSTGDQVRDVRHVLDRAGQLGLKVIFSQVYQYDGDREVIRKFGKHEGSPHDIAVATAREFSAHPALLAWYVSDEKTREDIPGAQALREVISAADPRHPVWSLTCHTRDLPFYGVSGDIIGVDPYPLLRKEDRSIRMVSEFMTAANRTGLPCWVVPQINNVGIYKTWGKPEAYRAGRFPTAPELRAMPLLAAIHGAKGFVFYSYFDAVIKSRRMAPDIAEREWAKIAPLAPMLRKLEPFLLSLEKAPEVEVAGCRPGEVEARAFADAVGNIRVIIAGTGEPVRAVVTIPGFDKLQSTYGQTRNLGGGRYEFTATEADGDILTGTPITSKTGE